LSLLFPLDNLFLLSLKLSNKLFFLNSGLESAFMVGSDSPESHSDSPDPLSLLSSSSKLLRDFLSLEILSRITDTSLLSPFTLKSSTSSIETTELLDELSIFLITLIALALSLLLFLITFTFDWFLDKDDQLDDSSVDQLSFSLCCFGDTDCGLIILTLLILLVVMASSSSSSKELELLLLLL